ncbi:MAG: flagellar basal body-associated FliL family protein [Hyphomonadaceae bacterium]|nr:flagellar basal body-associated FliL family protein [Hyphomonadaceae bacterium]
MAKKEKAKKTEEPEAEKPAVAEGEEGAAPAKKKMAGKTLILFIVLPAVLVLGGGGAAAMMLLGGGKKAETAEAHGEAAAGHDKKPEKKAEKKDDHGGGATATAGAESDVGHLLECEEGEACYYAMPDIMVNLAGPEGERAQFLKLELVLEASDASSFDEVPSAIPRMKDQLTTFLRELRVEDLNGSAGTYRLRRELMKRFNIVMAPAKIDAVLIEGMLIQ